MSVHAQQGRTSLLCARLQPTKDLARPLQARAGDGHRSAWRPDQQAAATRQAHAIPKPGQIGQGTPNALAAAAADKGVKPAGQRMAAAGAALVPKLEGPPDGPEAYVGASLLDFLNDDLLPSARARPAQSCPHPSPCLLPLLPLPDAPRARVRACVRVCACARVCVCACACACAPLPPGILPRHGSPHVAPGSIPALRLMTLLTPCRPTGSILDIHKAKPAATVSYAKPMPDIEALMQEWPPEVEAFLKSMRMPTGDVVRAARGGLGPLLRRSSHATRVAMACVRSARRAPAGRAVCGCCAVPSRAWDQPASPDRPTWSVDLRSTAGAGPQDVRQDGVHAAGHPRVRRPHRVAARAVHALPGVQEQPHLQVGRLMGCGWLPGCGLPREQGGQHWVARA
jgi:hypothetical protein